MWKRWKSKKKVDLAKLAAENEDYSEDGLLKALARRRKERELNEKANDRGDSADPGQSSDRG